MTEEFLRYFALELNRSALTTDAYRRDLHEMAAHLGMDEDLSDAATISTSDLRAWIAEMSRAGLSARSLRRKTQAARAFFRWMQKQELISVNPAAEIKLAKTGRKLPEYVKEQEMEALLDREDEADGDILDTRNRLILKILYCCGIRRDELVKITDADIDVYSKELRVHGKRDKTRVIPLADELVSDIRKWQGIRDSRFSLPRPAPLICSSRGALTGKGVYRIVRGMLEGTGATHKSPHSLRHTFATSMLNGGAEINSVKELLGHASLQSTQIYTHLTFNDILKTYNTSHPRAKKD